MTEAVGRVVLGRSSNILSTSSEIHTHRAPHASLLMLLEQHSEQAGHFGRSPR